RVKVLVGVEVGGQPASTVMVPFIFFFQAEDGIRDLIVTGVQTCALPICLCAGLAGLVAASNIKGADANHAGLFLELDAILAVVEIGRASCRERGWRAGVAG